MLISTESCGILKQENKDIFDMDFMCKKDTLEESAKKENDFFELSMMPNKAAALCEEEHITTSEIAEPTAEEEVAEDISVEVPAESPAVISECTDENTNESAIEVEIIEKSFTETPAEDKKLPQKEKSKNIPSNDNDSVIVSVVNWGKSNDRTPKKSKTDPTDKPISKKNDTIISTEDGFEIKLCSFRSLANRKDNTNNTIKKK